MTQTIASESSGTTLSRLDDEGRAILFTSARTASTFSDRPSCRPIPGQGTGGNGVVSTAMRPRDQTAGPRGSARTLLREQLS